MEEEKNTTCEALFLYGKYEGHLKDNWPLLTIHTLNFVLIIKSQTIPLVHNLKGSNGKVILCFPYWFNREWH